IENSLFEAMAGPGGSPRHRVQPKALPPLLARRKLERFRLDSVPRIATWTGHSLKEAILDANALSRDIQRVERTVLKLEATRKLQTVAQTVATGSGSVLTKCLKTLVGAPGLE